MPTITEVNCPTCSKKVTWCDESTYRPFCSDRCQKIDLGAWADESYTIPVEVKDEWALAEHQSAIEQAMLSKENKLKH